MKEIIRIFLVDNHELVRHGLRHMLEPEEDIEVVGDYASAEELFHQLETLSPDIVVMDANMPGMNGIEATRNLKRNGLPCDTDVIILAESANYRTEALEAGAVSYLLKDITCAELAQSIREVYWSKQFPGERNGFVEEVVELLVPPPANAAQLLRFMCHLEEIFEGTYASIIHTVGSWDWGTMITILLQPTILSRILDELDNMPEVEKVEEKPLVRDTLPIFLKKFEGLPGVGISPSKRLLVSLKGNSTASQELVTVLS